MKVSWTEHKTNEEWLTQKEILLEVDSRDGHIIENNVRRTNKGRRVVEDQERCSWIGCLRRRKTISDKH